MLNFAYSLIKIVPDFGILITLWEPPSHWSCYYNQTSTSSAGTCYHTCSELSSFRIPCEVISSSWWTTRRDWTQRLMRWPWSINGWSDQVRHVCSESQSVFELRLGLITCDGLRGVHMAKCCALPWWVRVWDNFIVAYQIIRISLFYLCSRSSHQRHLDVSWFWFWLHIMMMSRSVHLSGKFISIALEDEGDINAYLGINITRPTKTSIKLKQPTLIQRIIDSLNLKDQRQHEMPAGQIAIPYHHFRHHVKAGTIIIEKVATQENLADIFTKPLPLVTFRYLRLKLLG